MRRLLPIVALVLLAPSASAEAASFPLGDGQNPGVAVDGVGTAYVGWQTAAHAIQLCVLPTRARSCSVLANVAFPGQGYDRSRVSVIASGTATVDVVVPRNAEQGNNTYLARSTDGGATFAPAIRVSDQGFEQAVPGPDGRLAMVGGLGLTAGVVAPDGSGRGTEGAELGGGIVGQYGDVATQGAEVVAAGSSAGGAVAFLLPAGGDPNNPDAWQRLADLADGRQPELAASAHGLVALLEPVSRPGGLFAQRLAGTGWTPPVRVTADPLNNDFELAEGGAGRVSALRTDGSPYRLRYATSTDGGTFWSSEVAVARLGDFPEDLEAAAGADGRGVAVTTVADRVVAARFSPADAPVASRRLGRDRVQVRSLCDGDVNVLVLEAKRAGRRIPPSRVLRGASFGRARGATRVGARRYDLNRARSRVAVRLRPRSGRAKTLRLRLHRCV